MIDPIQSDPVQPQIPAVSPAASAAASLVSSGSTVAPDVSVSVSAAKTSAPSDRQSAPAASASSTPSPSSSSSSGSDASSDAAAQPLRLLIEHDKSTNQYVYKLYDSSGRIVREIPQESLAEAQKQANGALGSLVDTKV